MPTWTKVAGLIAEHDQLRVVCGGAPSQWALYRFTVKLRENAPLLSAALDSVTASLASELPEYGRDLTVDGSDLPGYANGQRYVSKNGPERERFSDADASWGHRSAVSTRKGGGFYGYKIHAAVCSRTGLPVAWEIATARRQECTLALGLIERAQARGLAVETAAFDKGYDLGSIYRECAERGIAAVIPLRQTSQVQRGEHLAPECEHGRWTFAGADFKRKRTKWRCPSGECEPKSRWVKADRLHPLIPRETKRWRDLYRGRAAVEREFGRLKHEYGLAPLRVRGLEKVALHADLTMLARLSLALARARAVPLAA